MTLKSRDRVTSHIFVKEQEGSSQKILKYVNCTYIRIFESSKGKMIIYSIFVFRIEHYSGYLLWF